MNDVQTKALLAAIHEEVKASPELFEIWSARERWRRWERILVIVLSCVLFPGLLMGLLMGLLCIPVLPFLFQFVFLGLGILGVPKEYEGLDNGLPLGFFCQTLFLTAISFMVADTRWRQLWQSEETAMQAFLPVADEVHFRRHIRIVVVWTTSIVAYFMMCGVGILAWSHQWHWTQTIGWLALAILQGVLQAAVVILLIGRFRLFSVPVVELCLLLSSWSLGIYGAFLRPHVEDYCLPAMAIFPVGWIQIAGYQVLVAGKLWGLCWLLPVFGVIALAAYRLRGTVWIREIIPVAGVRNRKFMQKSVDVVLEEDCARWHEPKWRRVSPKPQPPSRESTLTLDRLRLELTPISWRERGPIVRLAFSFLTTRERQLMTWLLRPTVSWKLWFLCSCVICAGTLALVDVLSLKACLLTIVVFPICWATGPGTLAWLRVDSTMPCAWLPMTPSELHRALRKLQAFSAVVILPALLIWTHRVALQFGLDFLQVFLPIACIFWLAWLSVSWMTLLFSVSPMPVGSYCRLLLELALAFIGLCVLVGSLRDVLESGSVWHALAFVLALGLFHWAVMRRAWHWVYSSSVDWR